ncbi:MerR family transcriptional regulator [Novosphingobium sp.]|uniref:MerR family transcriptional regulator n=1 Tax=Novosphingobium sp. TaxID=1874826 RepID=UPI003BA8FAAF
MRELEARTGVNRETIRVYLREGLLPDPSRPARNVADYGEEHVRAILAVRKLQRDSGMTLPQIAHVLRGGAASRPVGATAFGHLEELVAARVGVRKSVVSLDDLVKQMTHAREDARVLDGIGAIKITKGPAGDVLSVTDAGLVNLWGRMREAGFNEARGFPPEILGYYIEAAEYVAGKEAQIFLEQVEGKIEEDEAASMLEFALPTMLEFFGLLRLKIFLRNIRRATRGETIVPVPPGENP